jgi:hypothetical protein
MDNNIPSPVRVNENNSPLSIPPDISPKAGLRLNNLFLLISAIVIIVGSGGYLLGMNTTKGPATPNAISPTVQQKACTSEAKICPDGSSVGRIGPNCEFAPCPSTATTPIIQASPTAMLTGSEQLQVYDKPWSSYEGRVCDYSGCYTSEIEQQNQYWIDQAIKNKNINLCNNSLGFDSVPLGRPQEQSIYLCKATYAVGVGDLEYCRNLDKEVQYVGCRQKFAAEYHKPEICDEIKTPGYENLNASVVEACKKEASK